jgi:hypothetical protein
MQHGVIALGRRATVALAVVLGVACQREPAPAAVEPPGPAAQNPTGAAQNPTGAAQNPPQEATNPTKPVAPAPAVLATAPTAAAASPAQNGTQKHLEWLQGPATGPLAPYLVTELARAKADGRRLVLYIGATWCEPCRRFHEAAQAGQLDDIFADLRVIEFDLDRDRDRLAADGYASQMIPLIALPGPDGRGNGKGMQGSVKGDGAVANMRPRLQELLAQP